MTPVVGWFRDRGDFFEMVLRSSDRLLQHRAHDRAACGQLSCIMRRPHTAPIGALSSSSKGRVYAKHRKIQKTSRHHE